LCPSVATRALLHATRVLGVRRGGGCPHLGGAQVLGRSPQEARLRQPAQVQHQLQQVLAVGVGQHGSAHVRRQHLARPRGSGGGEIWVRGGLAWRGGAAGRQAGCRETRARPALPPAPGRPGHRTPWRCCPPRPPRGQLHEQQRCARISIRRAHPTRASVSAHALRGPHRHPPTLIAAMHSWTGCGAVQATLSPPGSSRDPAKQVSVRCEPTRDRAPRAQHGLHDA